MQTFELEVCQRLPLADSVFRLLDFCTDDGFLDNIFDRYRGRSYEDVLTFPQFVQVISDTLLGRQRSAHQTFQTAHEAGTVPTGVAALYGKLRRVPLTLSQGLLGEATDRLRQVFPDASDPLPASLDGLEVFAFDGKKIKFVAKRLKLLRPLRGQILGGKLLVAQHVATGLAVAIQAEVFDLRHLIGSTPQATAFQAAFCFLLSNVIQTVRGYIAQAQKCNPETISTELLFADVVEELTVWQKFLSASQTLAWLGTEVKTPEQVMAYLRNRLAGTWQKRWRKATPQKPPTQKPPTQKPPTRYLKGGHSSVYRILRGTHEVSSDPAQTNPARC